MNPNKSQIIESLEDFLGKFTLTKEKWNLGSGIQFPIRPFHFPFSVSPVYNTTHYSAECRVQAGTRNNPNFFGNGHNFLNFEN